MQQMNEWLDREQSRHFSSLLQVESEFIEVAIAADCLRRAVEGDKNSPNYEGVIAIYSAMLKEKLKLFDAMLKRKDERDKALNLVLNTHSEKPFLVNETTVITLNQRA